MVRLDGGVADSRGLGSERAFVETRGRKVDESRGSNGISKIAQWALMRVRWTLPLTNE